MKANSRILGATALLILATLGTGAAAWADNENPLVTFLKWAFSGVQSENANSQKVKDFAKATRNRIVITNEGRGAWKFGYLKDYKKELGAVQSGTLELWEARLGQDKLKAMPALAPDGDPVAIGTGYDAIVINPIPEGTVFKKNVYRVCYLQDGDGNRLYLTISKDAAGNAVPKLGVAAESNRLLYDQKPLEFSDKQKKDFNVVGIKVEKLKLVKG